jgi:hypothetical protein
MTLRSLGFAAALAAGLSSAPMSTEAATAQTTAARPAAELCLGAHAEKIENILSESREFRKAYEICVNIARDYPRLADVLERRGLELKSLNSRGAHLYGAYMAYESRTKDTKDLPSMGEAFAKEIISDFRGQQSHVDRLNDLLLDLQIVIGRIPASELSVLREQMLHGILPLMAAQEANERSNDIQN